MALNLTTQPPNSNNNLNLQDWPDSELSQDDAQKIFKFFVNITKFTGDKTKFTIWWRNIYLTLRIRKLNHHLLVKNQIPAQGEDDLQEARESNRIFVMQMIENSLNGVALSKITTCSNVLITPRDIMEHLSESFNKTSDED